MKTREEEGERSVNIEDHEQVKERGELSKTNPKKKERTTRSIYSSSQGAPVIKEHLKVSDKYLKSFP